jgi:hypothetical protein
MEGAQSTVAPLNDILPGFVRPQESVDDLVAEYEAWVGGDQDGHDQVVEDFRAKMAQRSEGAHEFALKYLQPEYVCSHGQCNCGEKVSVLVQLEGRLAVARGRRAAYEALEKGLERQIMLHKEKLG